MITDLVMFFALAGTLIGRIKRSYTQNSWVEISKTPLFLPSQSMAGNCLEVTKNDC